MLTISHSNTGEERVFSVVFKIRRDDRGKLQLDGTQSSLVSVKLNLSESKAQPCYAFEPSKKLLKRLRKLHHITTKRYVQPMVIPHSPDKLLTFGYLVLTYSICNITIYQ